MGWALIGDDEGERKFQREREDAANAKTFERIEREAAERKAAEQNGTQ